jgi:hypothetical protein
VSVSKHHVVFPRVHTELGAATRSQLDDEGTNPSWIEAVWTREGG